MIEELLKKYKDVILYVFFGVCTTVVNTVVYWFCAHPLKFPVVPSTVMAWFFAVLFAYVTNRKWVFHSEAVGRRAVTKEIISFYICRLATGVVDWACMYIFVELIHQNDIVVKVLVNIAVIVLNYVASKLVIFRKKS